MIYTQIVQGLARVARRPYIRDRVVAGVVVFLFAAQVVAQNEPKRPHILGIAHVAVFVSDLDQARSFYRNFLGFDEPFSLRRADGSQWIGFIKINDQQYLELFKEDPRFAGLLSHLAFYTDDAGAMREYLVSRGVKLMGELHKGQTGDKFFSIRDPDGRLIEIVEYQPDSWSSRERGRFLPPTRASDHLTHIGITTISVPAALRFYRDLLGFQEIAQDMVSRAQPAWVSVRVPDGTDYIHLLFVPKAPLADQLKAQTHVGLASPDLGKSVLDLQSRTSGPMYTHPLEVQVGHEGKRIAGLVDPDGAKIELVETGAAANELPRGIGSTQKHLP
jgi:lactoylglutathione lyase